MDSTDERGGSGRDEGRTIEWCCSPECDGAICDESKGVTDVRRESDGVSECGRIRRCRFVSTDDFDGGRRIGSENLQVGTVVRTIRRICGAAGGAGIGDDRATVYRSDSRRFPV